MNHRTPIVIDIETKADQPWLDDEEARELWIDSLKIPGNYKKPESIQKWVADQLEQRADKAALSPFDGRIVAVGMQRLWEGHMQWCYASDCEQDVIADVADTFSTNTPNGAILCGFNLRHFDIPFITIRAAIHRIELPAWWPHAKSYTGVFDPIDLQGGKLDLWLKRFGCPPKTGSGADVADMTIDEVREYCRNDVIVERELIRKLACVSPLLRETKPQEATT